jgi:hypothetical protein
LRRRANLTLDRFEASLSAAASPADGSDKDLYILRMANRDTVIDKQLSVCILDYLAAKVGYRLAEEAVNGQTHLLIAYDNNKQDTVIQANDYSHKTSKDLRVLLY